MKEEKIAVDIVLLPPDEINQLAIDINKIFPDTASENYVLDIKTCLPHTTVLMGIINKEKIPELKNRINSILKETKLPKLKITHAITVPLADGTLISGLEIEKTKELQDFHNKIVDELASMLEYDNPQKEMFHNPDLVTEMSMTWLTNFLTASTKENYHPHITLGIGRPNQEITPIEFTPSKLALCHLGNYLTCREIL